MKSTKYDMSLSYHYGAKAAYIKALRIIQMKMKHGPTAMEEAIKKAIAFEDKHLDQIMDKWED